MRSTGNVRTAEGRISVAESLDTGSAAGRLVITIMGAVSQWEREAIGERTRDVLRHKRSQGERVGNIHYGYRLAEDGKHAEPDAAEQEVLATIHDLRCRPEPAGDRDGTERTRPTDPPRFSLALRVRQEFDQ